MMSKKLKKIILLSFLLLGIALTYFIDLKSPHHRQVASEQDAELQTQDLFDLSESTGDTFHKAFKYQTLKNAIISKQNSLMSLQIGLFLIKGADNKPVPMCENYPTIDFVFSAEGVAIAGVKPSIVMRIPCEVDFSKKHTTPFQINFTDLFAQKPDITEFKIKSATSETSGTLFINNSLGEWPTDWIWSGVRLYGKDGENLNISGYEIISVLGNVPYVHELTLTE